MGDLLPLLLYEATISLYAADANGQAGVALWAGACANEVRLRESFEEVLEASSGDPHAEAFHVDENHQIEIERLWVIQKGNSLPFRARRNQQYVLDITWNSGGYWYRRLYSGVTARTAELASAGVLHFAQSQVFRAQRYDEEGGSILLTPTSWPGVVLDDPLLVVGFFREAPFVVGEYLLGHYTWPVSLRAISAKIIVRAPQNVPTILGLEVDGILSGKQLVIPIGTPNVEISIEDLLGGLLIDAGKPVRWKILSGPQDISDAAWLGALSMRLA